MIKKYEHREIEKKIQERWRENEIFKIDFESSKEKFYLLDMFPYPSGDGLHMGHTEQAAITDTFYRYKKMQDFEVLHPQGFDSFGLPAENYAVKTGVPPVETIKNTTQRFREQMDNLGLAYDFKGDIKTSNPDFYKHTQSLFGKFFENDLVYKKTAKANWCSSCNTIIANEQIEGGKCERCKTEIEQKDMPSWMFRITDFADDLIWKMDESDGVDWPEHTKKNQNAWIGKSTGANIEFSTTVEDKIEVFTTRPDTLFGATYMVLAPEHELVQKWKGQIENWDEVEKYISDTKKKTELERLESKDKTGVELRGVKAINPALEKSGMDDVEIPIFISDYVLVGYGTGAIMAVPAHDERDNEFAKKFGVEIKQAIKPVFIEKKNPIVDGKDTIVRNTIHVILINKETGQFGAMKWKGKLEGVKTFLMGGVEEGETEEEAAIKEIMEESGYLNPIKKGELRYRYTSKYFAAHKDVNRVAHVKTFVFEVSDNNKIDVSDEEKVIQELVWMNRKEIRDFLTIDEDKFQWDQYLNETAIVANGILVNSGEFDGMDSEEAKEKITEFVGGKMASTYRLRDWSISRQRYWGTPIPMVYSPEGEARFVGEENLPWLLPTDVDFVPTGEAPLAKSKELKERVERIFGEGWTPEVDTMDTFVDSSWYFLRYVDPENKETFASEERLKKWMPVDLYIGGAEHTYMHLLYARFFTRAMQKMGLIDFKEPFLKLRHQGMVNDIHGKKMSKSKGNVVNPDEMVERFGADATRAYMLFAGPIEDDVMWNEDNIVGVYRWIEKIWRQQEKLVEDPGSVVLARGSVGDSPGVVKNASTLPFKKELHKTIKSVSNHMEKLRFNVAISDMMKLMNFADKQEKINKEDYFEFIKLVSPLIPHVADEILMRSDLLSGCVPASMRQVGSLEKGVNEVFAVKLDWPNFKEELVKDDLITLAVQVNGKKRGDIQVSPEAEESEVMEKSKADEEIKKWLEGDIKKVIYVKGRILNFVV